MYLGKRRAQGGGTGAQGAPSEVALTLSVVQVQGWHLRADATLTCSAGNPTVLSLALTTQKSHFRASYRLGSAPL